MLSFETKSAEETRRLASLLAKLTRPGDLLLLNGTLGAGKTTFTQGLGQALEVQGRVTSPTFIISRVHEPATAGGTGLVHVDAYRIEDLDDLETLDLDSSLDSSVTVVEWGQGKVESLSSSRLEVEFRVPSADELAECESGEDEPRLIVLRAVGDDWDGRREQLQQLWQEWSDGETNV